MRKMCFLLVTAAFLTISISAQTTTRVSFARGANSAKVKTTLVGKGYVDYVIRAKAGQALTIELTPASKAELVIIEPSGDIMPDAVGIGGFWGILDYTGDYTVRVSLDEKSRKRKAGTEVSLLFKIINAD